MSPSDSPSEGLTVQWEEPLILPTIGEGRPVAMHTEVPVKVNAWIDEGIAPLVAALNEFPDILTLDSCHGNNDQPAYVLFKFRGKPEDAGKAAQRLVEDLGSVDLPCDYTLRLEWLQDYPEPMAHLLTAPGSVQRLAEAFTRVNSRRTTESAGGSADRALGSSPVCRPRPPLGRGRGDTPLRSE